MQQQFLQATKVLLQAVADRDIPSGVNGAVWGGPRAAGNSPFGALAGLGRNTRPNFFTHMPCRPEWWPLKVSQKTKIECINITVKH